MANKRKSMRKKKHVLRLAWEAGLGRRQIARSLSMSPTTVAEYLRRAAMAGLSWPLPEEWDDRQLEARLFPSLPKAARDDRPLPDWAEVHRELTRKGVTLLLLWEEHKANPSRRSAVQPVLCALSRLGGQTGSGDASAAPGGREVIR